MHLLDVPKYALKLLGVLLPVERSSNLTLRVFSNSVIARDTAVAETPKRRAVSEKLLV
jgi:hypothetical protein